MYSELNFLWEAWLKVFTNNKFEAVENESPGQRSQGIPGAHGKGCFAEYYRVLEARLVDDSGVS